MMVTRIGGNAPIGGAAKIGAAAYGGAGGGSKEVKELKIFEGVVELTTDADYPEWKIGTIEEFDFTPGIVPGAEVILTLNGTEYHSTAINDHDVTRVLFADASIIIGLYSGGYDVGITTLQDYSIEGDNEVKIAIDTSKAVTAFKGEVTFVSMPWLDEWVAPMEGFEPDASWAVGQAAFMRVDGVDRGVALIENREDVWWYQKTESPFGFAVWLYDTTWYFTVADNTEWTGTHEIEVTYIPKE